jgi:DNA primase
VNAFETLRERMDLAELAGSVTEMAPAGGALKGRCPLPGHEDENPSFYVYPDGRFYCFGCRRRGDAVDLWAAIRGLEPGIGAALDLAREHGVDLPESGPEARERTERRWGLEAAHLARAEERHGALAAFPEVLEWWGRRGFDEGLRERFLLGACEGGAEATIPFWHRGRVRGIVRRKLEGEPKYVLSKKKEFPDGHRPLFVPGAVRAGMFLVEGYVDALALVALGYGAAAVGGTGMSELQAEEARRLPGALYYVLPDADEEGRKAARLWARGLYPKALLCPDDYETEVDDD